MRSRVLGLIKSALKFRQLSIPRPNVSLCVPFLAFPEFKIEVKKFLKSIISEARHHLLPFHIPSGTVREAAHPSIQTSLWNFRSWLQRFSDPDFRIDELTCPCQELLLLHPHLTTIDGHVASSASLLTTTPRLCALFSANTKSCYFPSKTFYIESTQHIFDSWLRNHGLPKYFQQSWTRFIESIWQNHLLHRQDRFTSSLIYKAKELIFNSFVIHCADHEATNLMLFCPIFYYNSVHNTWSDPTVFSPVPLSPAVFQLRMQSIIPRALLRRYKWGFDLSAPLPYGYVFLKRKKQFKVARTIISYSSSGLSKILKATAIVVQDILTSTWPSAFGHETSPMIWRRLHTFLVNHDSSVQLTVLNDDLVGFFNSIPQSKILLAVSLLLRSFQEKFPDRSQHRRGCISVNLGSSSKQFRTFRGTVKPLTKLNTRYIRIQDIHDIVQLSFELGVFTALGKCWKQIRGTSIGNQISPVLSSIVVSATEISWQSVYHSWWENAKLHSFIMRYVDNRFCLVPSRFHMELPFQVFSHREFYELPVEIEPTGDLKILGSVIDPIQRTVRYVIPSHPWQFRSIYSAGSHRLNLSGLRSRVVMIRRQTFPPNLIPSSLLLLFNAYVAAGFPSDLVAKTIYS